MKKISFLIKIACVIFLFNACEDNIDELNVRETNPVVLSELAITDIELDQVNVNNPAVTFNWTNADYGQETSINYSIQLSADASFTHPVITGSISGNNTITLSMAELNTAVGNVGLPPFSWNSVYARVVSSIGTQSSLEVPSNSIVFNVYPYFNYTFNDYYLVGSACSADWNNNNNNPPLFRDASNSNLYRYSGFFAAGQFKILETKGLWQPQWGTNDATTIDVNQGGGSDPGTFPYNNSDIPASGLYTFTINFATSTFTFEPLDLTYTPVDYTSISIQGSASSNVSMNQSSFDTHIWYLNNVHLTQGGLQFLTNTSSTWSGLTSFSGMASENDDFLPVVVEDDYDVWFNDLTGEYILIPLNL